MMKFQIYRAVATIFFLLTLAVSFPPLRSSERWADVRMVITIVVAILFFVCYSFLLSIFNYYEEPGWKNVAVIIFLSGNSVFYFLPLTRAMPNLFFNFSLLIFYLPLIVAFAGVNDRGIKPLTQSFAYLMLIICLLHIVLPFIRGAIDLSGYIYLFNSLFLLPSALMVLLFHRMVIVSGREDKEESDEEQHDLL
jgi:hypothetical protein